MTGRVLLGSAGIRLVSNTLNQGEPASLPSSFCSWAAGAFCTPARQHAAKGPTCAHTCRFLSRNEGNDTMTLHSLHQGWGGFLFFIGSQWCSQVTRTIVSTCLSFFFWSDRWL
jgi:hypothetical protein